MLTVQLPRMWIWTGYDIGFCEFESTTVLNTNLAKFGGLSIGASGTELSNQTPRPNDEKKCRGVWLDNKYQMGEMWMK